MNNIAHKVTPTVAPRNTSILVSYEISFRQNNVNCPNMLPWHSTRQYGKPNQCLSKRSLNPNDNPIVTKKSADGVPDSKSTITRRPDIAHADIIPASVQ